MTDRTDELSERARTAVDKAHDADELNEAELLRIFLTALFGLFRISRLEVEAGRGDGETAKAAHESVEALLGIIKEGERKPRRRRSARKG